MIKLLILKGVLCLLAGLANAGCDTQAHHYGKSVFRFWDQQYWGPTSWENKNHRPWYVPVEFTDGWHLLKGIMLISLIVAVALPSDFLWWGWDALACRVVFWVGFVLGYNGIWLRK